MKKSGLSRFKWGVIVFIEIIFIILFIGARSESTTHFTFSQEDLFYNTGDVGFYIDTSEEKTIMTPEFILTPGMYTLKVKYDSIGESVLSVQYVDGRLNGNVSGNIPLANMSERQCDFKVRYSNRPIQVIGRMRGDAGGGDYLLIDEITIEPSPVGLRNLIFTSIVFVIIVNFILYVFVNRRAFYISDENKLIMKGLLVITLFTCLPLMVDYLFSSAHDLQFHLARIEGIKAGLQNHMFPVRIQPNWMNGYGYAASVFYGDIFLYIPALLRLVGVSLQSSYQFYVLLVNIATVFCSYWCFSRMSNKKIGIVCAAVYSLNIYRLVNIYSRAAVGEYTAMIFLPLILYGLWCVYRFKSDSREHRQSWIWISLGCTGVFMSHLITCELVALFVILVCLIFGRKTFQKQNFSVLVKSVICMLLLNLWFIIPFVDYMLTGGYVINAPNSWTPFRADERAAFIAQLFVNNYNVIGTSQGHDMGMVNEMPQTLGSVAIIVIGAWFLFYMGNQKTSNIQKREECIAICFLGMSMLLSTCLIPYTVLGEWIPILQYPIRTIQYMWRFLTVGGVFLAWVISILLYNDSIAKEKRRYLSLTILAVTFIQSLSFMSDILLKNEPVRIYDEGNLTTFEVAGGEYLPIESVGYKNFVKNLNYDSSVVIVDEWEYVGDEIQVKAENLSSESQQIEIPLLYYKGYKVVDEEGTLLVIGSGDTGLISVSLPEGYNGTFAVRFEELWYWRISEVISLAFLLFLLYKGLLKNRKWKDKSTDSGILVWDISHSGIEE